VLGVYVPVTVYEAGGICLSMTTGTDTSTNEPLPVGTVCVAHVGVGEVDRQTVAVPS
jgi:hypothetical protein